MSVVSDDESIISEILTHYENSDDDEHYDEEYEILKARFFISLSHNLKFLKLNFFV